MPAASQDMLGAGRGATARRAARPVGRSRSVQNVVAVTDLDQQVVDFLALHRGAWFCDWCLAVELGLLERHAVEYVTDDLAAGLTHSRCRGACRGCGRQAIVTTAN